MAVPLRGGGENSVVEDVRGACEVCGPDRRQPILRPPHTADGGLLAFTNTGCGSVSYPSTVVRRGSGGVSATAAAGAARPPSSRAEDDAVGSGDGGCGVCRRGEGGGSGKCRGVVEEEEEEDDDVGSASLGYSTPTVTSRWALDGWRAEDRGKTGMRGTSLPFPSAPTAVGS